MNLRARLTPSPYGWSLVDRARSAQPVYSELVPSTEAFFCSLPVGRALALSSFTSLLAHLIPSDRLVYVCGVLLFSLTVSGVKKGQKSYSVSKDRAVSIGGLIGVDPARVYWLTTSATALLDVTLIALISLTLALLTGRILETVAIAGAVTIGRLLNEVLAQVAVTMREVQIPQYVYVPVATLLGMSALYVAGVPRQLTSSLSLGLLIVGQLVIVVAAVPLVLKITDLAMNHEVRSRVLFPTARGRNLPLPLRMWTISDRMTTSLTLGLSLFVFLFVYSFQTVIRSRLSVMPRYVEPELTLAAFYLAGYAIALVFREPMNLATLRQRGPLFQMLGLSLAEEGRILWWGIAPTTFLACVPIAIVFANAGLTYPITFVLSCVLAVVAAVWASYLGAIGSFARGSFGINDAPAPVLAQTSLPALLACLLAVGYASSLPADYDVKMDIALGIGLVVCSSIIHVAGRRSSRKRLATT